ncbi:MAG: hypothetical protein AAGJ10_14000 [Bacteroidota bacterium]
MSTRSIKWFRLAVLVLASVGLASCDSGAEDTSDDETLVIEGARVNVNGSVSLEVRNGMVEGTLPVPLNGQTGVITVDFQDASGAWRPAESLEDEYQVTYQFPDFASLSWEPIGASDHEFVLLGIKPGLTSFSATVMDGRDVFYETPPLRVDVRTAD